MAEKKREVNFVSGTGRRKTAVARVWLYEKKKSPVEGLVVNDQPIDEYFADEAKAALKYLRPFQLTVTVGKFAASIKVSGGGKSAQLDAVVHGLARALERYNPEFRSALKKENLLTRDPREKERKKYFLKKARKRPQYSKR
jgi:small subunit ribosomal protein S9